MRYPAFVMLMYPLTRTIAVKELSLVLRGSGPSQFHSFREFTWLNQKPSVKVTGENNLEAESGAIESQFRTES
jgi:hypothetical protein